MERTMSEDRSRSDSTRDTVQEPEQASIQNDPHTELELEDSDNDSTEGLLGRSPRHASSPVSPRFRGIERLRPHWLGVGLFLILFAFWVLDSLKDPVFAVLVNGNLDKHQPPAKLCSVASTLALVCLLEVLSHARNQSKISAERPTSDEDVLDGGGRWTRMITNDQQGSSNDAANDRVPVSIFAYVGVSYMVLFSLLAFLVGLHPSFSDGNVKPSTTTVPLSSSMKAAWHVLAYILYASIESFGSLSVATFWSYTNSTLSLQDAERFYGIIIAIAQLGAIGGSSMVTTHYWPATTLVCVAILVISLQTMVMISYDRRFPPTFELTVDHLPSREAAATNEKPVFWSGVFLILKHNYVLLILGVSCLYEVSLTCLDYQMKLLGWERFEDNASSFSPDMSFTKFMGRYGQLTNMTSLVFSYFLFPFLIQTYGLRLTLRLFPSLLLVATIVAYGAFPGNLAVLFVSMSILKAMTYSIHDPSKEILYLPTSNAIKFRAKFWIDVVGARVAKAVGSSINTYAGSVEQSVRMGTVPSLLTAAALWFTCYRAGIAFDKLVLHGTIVGHSEPTNGGSLYNLSGYSRLSTVSEESLVSSDMEQDESLSLVSDSHIKQPVSSQGGDVELAPR